MRIYHKIISNIYIYIYIYFFGIRAGSGRVLWLGAVVEGQLLMVVHQ